MLFGDVQTMVLSWIEKLSAELIFSLSEWMSVSDMRESICLSRTV